MRVTVADLAVAPVMGLRLMRARALQIGVLALDPAQTGADDFRSR